MVAENSNKLPGMSEDRVEVECPFCGNNWGDVIPVDEDGYLFAWWCSECKATGPLVEYEDRTDGEELQDIPEGARKEAIRRWGMRHDQSVAKSVEKQKKSGWLEPYPPGARYGLVSRKNLIGK